MDKLIRKIILEETEEVNADDLFKEPLKTDPSKGIVAPSKKVISDVCEKEKFCQKQGPITFGQLRVLIETAQKKNLSYDIGEGFYKAMLRLFPWFFPQIAIAGFVGSSVRAFNKIIKPGLEDTRGYKKWWGKTLIRIMDTVEGDIPHEDPISKIFFISDGLLHMMDRKFKIKFARYVAELAASKPDSEPVPEYFVENELRKWVNQKFLINPPLGPKTMNESEEDDWGWAKEIEIKTDLTPSQIYNRYKSFPIEIVGPYIAGQYRDVRYENGELYLFVSGWCDFVNLFQDTDSNYGWMGRSLAKAVLCDDDYWEPYYSSDLISNWYDDVWNMVTNDEELLEHVKQYIIKNFIGEPLDSDEDPDGEGLREDMLQDNQLLGTLIDDEDIFMDLKNELSWAYGSAYNMAASNNIYNAAVNAIIDIFGKGTWGARDLEFKATDVIMDSVKNKISSCWDYCDRYYDSDKHYDPEEHEDEIEAIESYCPECIDTPFDDWGYFIDFYIDFLNEEGEGLSARYDEYPSDDDLKDYFRDDVYGRI